MSVHPTVVPLLAPVKDALSSIDGLPSMFERCFLNTLETTVSFGPKDEVFVITGDIPAMWLRDSTAQVLHYVRFTRKNAYLRDLVRRLLARQMRCIRIDPYANAFNRAADGSRAYDDRPRQLPEVWERKYEIDSLCYPLLLAQRYIENTQDASILDDAFFAALQTILDVFAREQRHETQSPYRFERRDCPPSDTLVREGRGAPVGYTGMTWSGFRPSDDACAYGYLVPSNLFAARVLSDAARLARESGRPKLAIRAEALETQIRDGVALHAHVRHPRFGDIYAYEVDGLGNALLMDDANVPSLLSLPYLGVCGADDPLYKRTRAFVLSGENPAYCSGSRAQGVGSPHTPPRYVWPIALCVQAMTSGDIAERARLLALLLQTHAGTGLMHESFDADDPARYTRPWFAWANSMFGDMIYRFYEDGSLAPILDRVRGVHGVNTI